MGGPAYDKIISQFGEDVRSEGGDIDRRKLGAIVFNDRVSCTSLTVCSLSSPVPLVETLCHGFCDLVHTIPAC